MKIKNQLILSPGVNPNKVRYETASIDKLKLPKILPVFDHRQKIAGSAKNFVRKKHKVYCDIECENIVRDGMGAAVTLVVKDVEQKKDHVVAKGLELVEVSVVPNFYDKYSLNRIVEE